MTTTTEVQPIHGPLFRQVVAIGHETIGGTKRTRLLALLAAYADAGQPSPTVRVLASTLNLPGGRERAIRYLDCLIHVLERDGWLKVKRTKHERNVYTLMLPDRVEDEAA